MTERVNGRAGVVHVAPGEGEVVTVLDDVATYKLPSAITGGGLVVAEVVTPPGGGPPALHTHPPMEAFYVLEGEYEISGMGENGPFAVRATPGSVVFVPPGAPHNFKNVGSTPGRMLSVHTSPLMENFGRAVAAEVARATPIDPFGPAKLAPILAAHEIAFVGPSVNE